MPLHHLEVQLRPRLLLASRRRARLAGVGHALEAANGFQAHDARHDRHIDALLLARGEDVLRDDELGTGIDLILQVHDLVLGR